jgi:hypothetical protein
MKAYTAYAHFPKRLSAVVLMLVSILFLLATTGCLDKKALLARYPTEQNAARNAGEAVFVATVAQEELMNAIGEIVASRLNVTVDKTATDLILACEAVASGEADSAFVDVNGLEGDELDTLADSSRVLCRDGVKFIAHPEFETDDISEDDVRALANRDEAYFEDYDKTPAFIACDNNKHNWQFMLQVFDINPEGSRGNTLEVERDPRTIENNDAAIVTRVLAEKNAVGLVSLDTDVGDALVLTVEGTAPHDEEYSLAMPLLLVWREPQNEVARTIVGLFDGEEGTQLLRNLNLLGDASLQERLTEKAEK